MNDDTRRIIDGIRLHPHLGEILAGGANQLRWKNPGKKLTNLEFCRSAIAHLEKLDLIYKIEASVSSPRGWDDRSAKLAKRQGGTPIWFPTNELAVQSWEIWPKLSPSLEGKVIVWQT